MDEELDQSMNPPCGMCDDSIVKPDQSERYCMECEMYMCAVCVPIHATVPRWKNHQVIECWQVSSMKPDQNVCAYHLNKKLKYFCRVCSTTVCSSCLVTGGDHYLHSHSSIEQKARELQAELLGSKHALQKRLLMCSERQSSLEASVARVQHRVGNCNENIRSQLDKVIKELNKLCKDELNKNTKVLEEYMRQVDLGVRQLKEYETDLGQLMSIVNRCEQESLTYSDLSAVQFSRVMEFVPPTEPVTGVLRNNLPDISVHNTIDLTDDGPVPSVIIGRIAEPAAAPMSSTEPAQFSGTSHKTVRANASTLTSSLVDASKPKLLNPTDRLNSSFVDKPFPSSVFSITCSSTNELNSRSDSFHPNSDVCKSVVSSVSQPFDPCANSFAPTFKSLERGIKTFDCDNTAVGPSLINLKHCLKSTESATTSSESAIQSFKSGNKCLDFDNKGSVLGKILSKSEVRRRYRCPLCGRGFGLNGNLKRHMKTHTGVKPFSCSMCAKSFIQKHHLQSHIRVHHGQNRFNYPHKTNLRIANGNFLSSTE